VHNSGISSLHCWSTRGQRVPKRQPEGGAIGDGGSPPAPSQWDDALDDAGDTQRQRPPVPAYAALRNEKKTQDNAGFQNNAQLSELAKQLNRPDQIVTKPPLHIGADPPSASIGEIR
jgi:hypothetical protein